MLGVYVDEFERPEKGGFILEGGGAGPIELGMSTEPGTGKPYVAFMEKAKQYASCVTLIHDHNVGQIRWEDGQKHTVKSHTTLPEFESTTSAFTPVAFPALVRILVARVSVYTWAP